MTDVLPSKDPVDVLDYRIDASGLLAEGETLVEGDSSITVAGATKDSAPFEDDAVTVWISGGTAGELIFVTATLVTSGGRTFNRLYVIPYGEPVTLEQAKQHARVLSDDEDVTIARYIRAARGWVERYTGLSLIRREFTQEFHCFGSYLDLAYGPVETVEGVSYTDSAGADQDFEDFILRRSSRVYPVSSWPTLGTNGAVTVTYTAGFADGQVPDVLLQAIHVLVNSWFESRSPDKIPGAAIALCDSYRVPAL